MPRGFCVIDENGKIVSVTTDGSKKCLDVSVNAGDFVDNSLRYAQMTPSQTLNSSTYTTIFSKSGAGFLYGFLMNFTKVGILLTLTVDGVDIFADVNLEDILSDGEYGLNSEVAGGGLPKWIYSYANSAANKHFAVELPQKMKYATDFVIKAKRTSGSGNLDFGAVVHT